MAALYYYHPVRGINSGARGLGNGLNAINAANGVIAVNGDQGLNDRNQPGRVSTDSWSNAVWDERPNASVEAQELAIGVMDRMRGPPDLAWFTTLDPYQHDMGRALHTVANYLVRFAPNDSGVAAKWQQLIDDTETPQGLELLLATLNGALHILLCEALRDVEHVQRAHGLI